MPATTNRRGPRTGATTSSTWETEGGCIERVAASARRRSRTSRDRKFFRTRECSNVNRFLRGGASFPSTRHTGVRVGASDWDCAATARGSAPSRLRARSLAVGFALCALAPMARAGLFDDEEARKRIDATNQRVTQLSQQVDQLDQQLKSQGLMDLFNSIEQIKADISKLRGQIEVVTYEIEQSQKRQKDLYVDLDTRLRKLEGGGAASAPPDASTNVANAAAPGSAGAPGPTAGTFSPPSPSTGANTGVAPPVPVNGGTLQTRSPTDITAAQPARAVRAILGRQRAVRAQGLSRVDRVAAPADPVLPRQPEGAGCAPQHRLRAGRHGRRRGRAEVARRADHQISAIRSGEQSEAAAGDEVGVNELRALPRDPGSSSTFAERISAWQRTHG